LRTLSDWNDKCVSKPNVTVGSLNLYADPVARIIRAPEVATRGSRT